LRIAVCPGSFDPVTYGHLDVIERAAGLFDKVIVAISTNPRKSPLFTIEERKDMLHQVLKSYPNVVVDAYDGLTVYYAKKKRAQAIIRGLRAISDFENELMMAHTNKKMVGEIDTVFLMTKAEYSFISSSGVKEVAFYGGCICGMVPPYVEKKLKEKVASIKGMNRDEGRNREA